MKTNIIKINIKKLLIDEEHWSSKWIPISYKNIINEKQLKKSYTFLWGNHKTQEVYGICRSYYINNENIEIGDVWLNDKYRGKSYNGIKYSVLFMKLVISKIWQTYPSIKKISLIVSENNIPAIKLYKKLNFAENKDSIVSKKIKLQLKIKEGIYMIRNKRIIKLNH